MESRVPRCKERLANVHHCLVCCDEFRETEATGAVNKAPVCQIRAGCQGAARFADCTRMSSGYRTLPRFFLAALFHPWTWRMAWRDSRSQRGRLLIFSLAIVAGIAALAAIHSLQASVQKGIETQAKALLGSDLQISSRQPLSDEDVARLQGMARDISRETTFPSMLKFLPGGGARMVQVRGLEGAYPYYGQVETKPAEGWQRLKEG